MKPPTAIVCLDLDGTSVEYDAIHAWFSDTVATQVNAACQRGAVWCTNSGRNAHNQYGMLQACRTLAVPPFAILANERYIFDVHPGTAALRGREPYNQRNKQKSRELCPRVKDILTPPLETLAAEFAVAEYFPASEFVGWLLESSADPVVFAERIRAWVSPIPQAQVLRNGRWVIITHVDFGKGLVLADAARGLGVPRERILALGDQQNDVDMLDGRCAAYVGCPGDADAEAKDAVQRAAGWIADEPGPAGTAALIRRFIETVLDGRL